MSRSFPWWSWVIIGALLLAILAQVELAYRRERCQCGHQRSAHAPRGGRCRCCPADDAHGYQRRGTVPL